MSEQIRQLAAIMYTDIVGYTSMMQHDEASALLKLEHHRGILEFTTEKHKGKILQYYGDGSLSIFQSAIEAVECAIEIQNELSKPPDVPLRIGIHLGDIIVKGQAIYGDGVNVASRVESLGIPGSILISDTMNLQVRNQPGIKTQSLGLYNFKNVDERIEVWAVSNQGIIVPTKTEISRRLKISEGVESPEKTFNKYRYWISGIAAVLLLLAGLLLYRMYFDSSGKKHAEKSVAVLPFENLSNDPDQEYFSNGITEDILNHLSKISNLRVKSRTSTLQYKDNSKTIPEIGKELGVDVIIEGSVRKEGNSLRIVAQLIDVETDEHIWSSTFDREITEIFQVQSEIAIEIATVLQVKLTDTELESLNKESWTDITAYDYGLKARQIYQNWNDQNDLENALQLFEQAIEVDATYAFGYYGIAAVLYYGMRNFGVPKELWIDQAFHMTEIAISVDPSLTEAYLLRSSIFRERLDKPDHARKDVLTAYELDPSNPEVLEFLGMEYIREGKYDLGPAMIIKSIELNYTKKDPEYYLKLGGVYKEIDEFEKAEILLQQGKNLAPDRSWSYTALGSLYMKWQKYDQAIDMYEESLKIAPNNPSTIDVLGWCNLVSGDLDNAEYYWSKYEELENEFMDETQYVPFRHRLAYIKFLKGEKEESDALFMEQLELDKETQQGLRGYGAWAQGSYYYDLAAVNAFLGNTKEAIIWLDSAASKGVFGEWLINNDPLLENIRQNKAYLAIVDREMVKKEDMVNGYRSVIKEFEVASLLK